VDGTLRVVADALPSPLDRLLQKQPRISNTMAVIEVRPPATETSMEIARRWIGRNDLQADDGVLREVWDLAQQYLNDRAAPGNVMDLLKSTRLRLAATAGEGQSELTAVDVIVTLARQTGLPAGLLDPTSDLDLNGLERALSDRVMGQEEAIQCLVDRVAMMKAGLADPTRPYGVFLFAGPTGTGKTEIAKSLATWLFGSANRLIRIDMSELQTPDSLDRLLGSTGSAETESLADQVRKQPFSVILLDEIEKAHPNVWDLFLQIFDDARVTDRRGRTVSFRHAIIILTANLGATIPTGLSIGFGSSAKHFDVDEVRTAVGRVFRREFINRLDRVIVFRPLDRELMRKILYRELREVFDRRGLKGRPWAVEWDESAIAYLLEKGFTPDLGARPLKRAVERYLLSPLAAAIVRHQFPEGDQFLFISCGGEGLRVEFVDPDLDEGKQEGLDQAAVAPTESAAGGIDLARSILLQPLGSPQNLAALGNLLEGIEAQLDSEEWRHRKHALFAKIDRPEFWSSPERFSVLGLIETIDRIEKGVERARSLGARIERHVGKDSLPRRLIALLAQNIYLLATACDDVTKDTPREAFLLVEARSEAIHDTVEALSFARQIADMYEAWAKKRNMRLTRLFRSNPRGELEMRALYSVSGYGAYSILEQESGLHVRERPGETRRAYQHDTTRVTVVPQPNEPLPSSASKVIGLVERVIEEFKHQTPEIVRRYREEPSPLVRDIARGWRTGRIDLVLGGDFDLF
jgi:ATP-dependent Clp protease ATP-binding subunit ClpC